MSRIFLPEYYLPWDPPPQTAGSPTIVDTGPVPTRRTFSLASNRDQMSSALLLTSFGVDIGPPVTDSERLLSGDRLQLHVNPKIAYSGFLSATGTFGSSLARSWLQIYVEEFLIDGSYVGGIQGVRHGIADLTRASLSGSLQSSPNRGQRDLLAWEEGQIPVQANRRYRAWVDLWGEIQAAGFPAWGGSSFRPFGSEAVAQVSVAVSEIAISFSRREF